MLRNLRIAYFAHTLRSDWNNGNAHFLRGLMRSMGKLGHEVVIFEPVNEWSITNLEAERNGLRSLRQFDQVYPELNVQTYTQSEPDEVWRERLSAVDFAILHEWNPPALAQLLLKLRGDSDFKLLFHDTHHRASSSPDEIARFGLLAFDGIIAFGNALRAIYKERFGIKQCWTLHEAADTTVFKPESTVRRENELVWIGNWGEGERSLEISKYLLEPARALREIMRTTIYGVRYPQDGLEALEQAGATYGGYLANLDAPNVYARARATVHVPRQQYSIAMRGIPTIRVFEALACGIPLVSAPWEDSEQLFSPGDFAWAHSTNEMEQTLRHLVNDPAAAEEQASQGLKSITARHTCDHRAQELTSILEEVLS